MRQAVATFTNSAARTAAITSPVEGQLTYLDDSNRYSMWNGSSWVSPFGSTLLINQTFTSAGLVTVDNVFSAQFDAYQILVQYTSQSGAPSAEASLQFRSGGTTNSSNYFYQRLQSFGTSEGSIGAGPVSATLISRVGPSGAFINLIVNNPFVASTTYGLGHSYDSDDVMRWIGFSQKSSNVFDGFAISAGTSSGNLKVYGLRN
jgi:hypothetical protein